MNNLKNMLTIILYLIKSKITSFHHHFLPITFLCLILYLLFYFKTVFYYYGLAYLAVATG